MRTTTLILLTSLSVAFGQWRTPSRSIPTIPEQVEQQSREQFREAQDYIAEELGDGRAYWVDYEDFAYQGHAEKAFVRGTYCPPEVTEYECCWGWFVYWLVPTEIHFTLRTESAGVVTVIGVRHESLHAIAWALNRPDWRTVGH
jgi:hypothetical protein